MNPYAMMTDRELERLTPMERVRVKKLRDPERSFRVARRQALVAMERAELPTLAEMADVDARLFRKDEIKRAVMMKQHYEAL